MLTNKNAKTQALLKRVMMRAWVILTLTRLELSLKRKMTRTKRRKRIESISYFVVFGHHTKIKSRKKFLILHQTQHII